jgi:hypothetical protein
LFFLAVIREGWISLFSLMEHKILNGQSFL